MFLLRLYYTRMVAPVYCYTPLINLIYIAEWVYSFRHETDDNIGVMVVMQLCSAHLIFNHKF
jgi:hypothetical protein